MRRTPYTLGAGEPSKSGNPALEAAGLEHRPPYNLRHSYAWHSLTAGVPIANVANQMGHSDVTRTFQVYGGWAVERGESVALLREKFLSRDQDVITPQQTHQ